MENKPNSEKYKKLEQSLKEVVTPERMLMEYPKSEEMKDGYICGNFSDFPNFSNWNNWPHSR